MKPFATILAVALVFALGAISLSCGGGEEPETVIVPVGEPGEGDPYEEGMDCASDTGAVEAAFFAPEDHPEEAAVLLTFFGAEQTWRLVVPVSDFRAARAELMRTWSPQQIAAVDRVDVDGMMQDLCAPFDDQRSEPGRRLHGLLKRLFPDRLEELASGVCQ